MRKRVVAATRCWHDIILYCALASTGLCYPPCLFFVTSFPDTFHERAYLIKSSYTHATSQNAMCACCNFFSRFAFEIVEKCCYQFQLLNRHKKDADPVSFFKSYRVFQRVCTFLPRIIERSFFGLPLCQFSLVCFTFDSDSSNQF